MLRLMLCPNLLRTPSLLVPHPLGKQYLSYRPYRTEQPCDRSELKMLDLLHGPFVMPASIKLHYQEPLHSQICL